MVEFAEMCLAAKTVFRYMPLQGSYGSFEIFAQLHVNKQGLFAVSINIPHPLLPEAIFPCIDVRKGNTGYNNVYCNGEKMFSSVFIHFVCFSV